MSGTSPDDLARFQHPRFARVYADMSAEADRRGGLEHRRRLLAGLRGSVIEVGAGNGLNFAHYPAEVTGVLAVEPEDTMRGLAERAAAAAPVPVRVVAGHAETLPAADGGFDNAVASLILCSVPDLGRALAELRRVLVPGGELRYYEHVRSDRPHIAAVEDIITPLWSRVAGGCHPNRDTATAIKAAGFTIDNHQRLGSSAPVRAPWLTHILGTARRA